MYTSLKLTFSPLSSNIQLCLLSAIFCAPTCGYVPLSIFCQTRHLLKEVKS